MFRLVAKFVIVVILISILRIVLLNCYFFLFCFYNGICIYIKVKFVAKSILVARILDILSIPYLLYTCTNFFMGSFNERVLNNI